MKKKAKNNSTYSLELYIDYGFPFLYIEKTCGKRKSKVKLKTTLISQDILKDLFNKSKNER